MTSAAGPGPTIIPAPRPVRAAGVLIGLEAVGVLVFTVIIEVSGARNGGAVGALIGQAVLFLLLAAGMVACGLCLLGGRRWGRSPTIVVQILLAAIGYYLAVPSGRPSWGIPLFLLAVVTAGLLLTRPANEWISRFPNPFGPTPHR